MRTVLFLLLLCACTLTAVGYSSQLSRYSSSSGGVPVAPPLPDDWNATCSRSWLAYEACSPAAPLFTNASGPLAPSWCYVQNPYGARLPTPGPHVSSCVSCGLARLGAAGLCCRSPRKSWNPPTALFSTPVHRSMHVRRPFPRLLRTRKQTHRGCVWHLPLPAALRPSRRPQRV